MSFGIILQYYLLDIVNMNRIKNFITSSLKAAFGHSALYPLKSIRAKINKRRYLGSLYECNLCESKLAEFFHFGPIQNDNHICPVCGSFGRQRFLWFILNMENLFPRRNQRVLHFAPEWCMERKLSSIVDKGNYISGDLNPNSASVVLDITNLKLADNSFDFVICSHVLEHIPDDVKALSELHRILADDGYLLMQVPIGRNMVTHEDSSIISELDRERVFGQSDHVRLYGSDIVQRLEHANFDVRAIDTRDAEFKSDFIRYAFDISEKSLQPYSCESRVYICTKQTAS